MLTNRRRKRRPGDGLGPMKDGEVFHVPMTFMDAAQRQTQAILARENGDGTDEDAGMTVHDGLGNPAGYKPGFAFAADDEDARDAAVATRQACIDRMSSAWKKPPADADQQDDPGNHADLTDAQLRDRVAKTYDAHSSWLANAWRK
jgi:hypothetical protein